MSFCIWIEGSRLQALYLRLTMKIERIQRLQRRWQFQLGLAFLVLPFLVLFWHYAKGSNSIIDSAVMDNRSVEAPDVEPLVAEGFAISNGMTPLIVIGTFLIIFAIFTNRTK